MNKLKISFRIFTFITMGTILTLSYSCKKDSSSSSTSTNTNNNNTTPGYVTDIDGNTYKTVTIGTQVWMASNLKVKHYNNGSAITYSTTSSSSGTYCYYSTLDSAKFGLFYNFAAVSTGNLAPTGWHVPTNADYTTLITYLGGATTAGAALKESGTADWMTPNTGATNSSGFTALPGGYFLGSATDITNDGNFWSSTASSSNAYYLYLYYGSTNATMDNGTQSLCLSVRCVKN